VVDALDAEIRFARASKQGFTASTMKSIVTGRGVFGRTAVWLVLALTAEIEPH
jgi:hypothetical protein